MPVIIESATLLSHDEDHRAGIINARVSYAFNTGAVEEKIHGGIPMSAVDAIAEADGRSVRQASDVCEVIRAALGEHAADLPFTVAAPPAPVANQ